MYKRQRKRERGFALVFHGDGGGGERERERQRKREFALVSHADGGRDRQTDRL